MTICILEFKLSSYWHIGSGTGADAVVDAVVARDGDGLPVIPGRTIKGLLRDAMQMATLSNCVKQERVEKWFGSALACGHEARNANENSVGEDEPQARLEQARFTTREGALWFGSARLPESWRNWARDARSASSSPRGASGDRASDPPEVQALFAHVASTALDGKGVALEHSLRVSEVAVPMTLCAEVRGPADDCTWMDDLDEALPLLRALGSRRSRGFGRVSVSIKPSKGGKTR